MDTALNVVLALATLLLLAYALRTAHLDGKARLERARRGWEQGR